MSTGGMQDDGEFDLEKSKQPVWTKIHSKHLLPETLEIYDLPWEWCMDDPDYILIKAWLDEDLQDELFHHTRRIREMESDPEREAEDDDRQDFLSDRDGGYHPPVCDGLGRSLSDDINLKPSVLKQSVDGFRVHPSHREYAGKVVDVVGSQISGFGKAILYRARNEAEELDSHFSWVHLQPEVRSLDEFLRFASNVPKLADEDRALVLSLLKRTRLQPGRWDMPSDVQRCVGVDPTASDGMAAEKWAVFLRFPYYSVQKAKGLAQYRTGTGEHPVSLLQYFYNLESTGKRGLDQVIRKVGLFRQVDIVHVSQLWVVIVHFRFIITCAPMPLTESASPSLEILNPALPKSSPAASIISVIDHRRRVFFFPMEQCKTYFV